MEQFEKWFEDYMKKCEDRWTRLLVKQMKKLYEFVWRAALEWILVCDTGPEADELIKKELGDT